MAQRILIVEDDRTLRDTLSEALQNEGFTVTTESSGADAADRVFERHFDLVLLDVMLPGRGGFEILREIRDRGLTTPVVMLTVKGDEHDRVLGFDLGADDYVTKPFSLRELLGRIRAVLRRTRGPAASEADPTDAGTAASFTIGDAEIDLSAYELRREGVVHALSPREVAMLRLLHREAGSVVTRERFLEEIWGGDAYVGHRTIDTHILNLRQKLESRPREPSHLLTVHGAGYRLVLPEAP